LLPYSDGVEHRVSGTRKRRSSLPAWLDLTADNEKVRTSALWNVNHVDDAYDPTLLDTLEQLAQSA